MSNVVRFGVSIHESLLKQFDQYIEEKRYTNRSEALRDLIRDHLVEQEWDENKETVGTITIVYDHGVHELMEKLTDLQHHYSSLIRSTLHIHLDQHRCLEVLVVRGRSGEIKRIADSLIATKGVKHGKLTATTTGKDLK
ncbi:MAG: nickel-responsive transcriptional regulator NikR (plasmid) [Candidatus Manganitrophus sp.]|jgi:CopG family nickel-responsive transcriptional regulator|uniref:Putative nickel-responsive regulator n=1 Tax=Candidatus Manganitrophus noduliformans TaxID=2606439 RepID=A0A7X6DUE7_9BACT|nr:nickel-responsive transcriptional regulator NikR [Candidatus Manganitrophus noduliformans]MCG3113280.1 nickel-responsive transcriptional regulator NikR [Candidatus Manganitrophus morganii]MDC4206967.1 nickel-responsive transcriptional regulator NikR [Candidatus Manganitrophus sp.]MDC4228229.1 nickel-responsive transcriptional regulator NikR [Candidatus Manganitrophus sp.]NKE73591.1 nickel-responsive transcriptional regulator NikR [Candidatus Manganitrophus noduliformans]WDT73514.1 MAG: nick